MFDRMGMMGVVDLRSLGFYKIKQEVPSRTSKQTLSF